MQNAEGVTSHKRFPLAAAARGEAGPLRPQPPLWCGGAWRGGEGPLQPTGLVSSPDAELEPDGIELASGVRGCEPHHSPTLPVGFNTAPCRLAEYWILKSHILALPNSCRRQKTCFFPILYIQEICTTRSLHVITHFKILHSLSLEPEDPSRGR